MSKGLTALRRFRDNAKFDNKSDYYLSTQYIDDNDIIEKELKRLDKIDNQVVLRVDKDSGRSQQVIDELSKRKYVNFTNLVDYKKIKALEIIKVKRVDTRAFIEILEDGWTWEQYMDEEDDINTGGHQFSRDRLTQEEYELLKEVLL